MLTMIQEHGKRPKVKSDQYYFYWLKCEKKLILTLLHRQKSSWGTDFQALFSFVSLRKVTGSFMFTPINPDCPQPHPDLTLHSMGFLPFIHWAAQDNQERYSSKERNSKEMTVYMYNLWKRNEKNSLQSGISLQNIYSKILLKALLFEWDKHSLNKHSQGQFFIINSDAPLGSISK